MGRKLKDEQWPMLKAAVMSNLTWPQVAAITGISRTTYGRIKAADNIDEFRSIGRRWTEGAKAHSLPFQPASHPEVGGVIMDLQRVIAAMQTNLQAAYETFGKRPDRSIIRLEAAIGRVEETKRSLGLNNPPEASNAE